MLGGNMTILVLPVAPPITPGLYCLMKFKTLGHVSQFPSLPVKNVEPRFSLFTSKMLLARAPVPYRSYLYLFSGIILKWSHLQ